MKKRYTGTRRPGHRLVPALNLLLAAAVCVLNYYYQVNHFDYRLKCYTSFCFAAIGVVNLLWSLRLQRKVGVCTLLALGLIAAMHGDIFINGDFILGAGLFALGHLLLLAGFCCMLPLRWVDVLCSLFPAAATLGFLLLYPYFNFPRPAIYHVCLGYAVIISCMLGKAAANFLRRPSLCAGLLALGSTLFVFSDVMLVLHWFVGRWRWTDNACMGTYYPAVCLIGLAMCALLSSESAKSRYR